MLEEKGYYITTAECCKFALTKEYETLYKLIFHLIDKVTGSIDVEKNTPQIFYYD